MKKPKPDVTEAARALVARRDTAPGKCVVCGKPFVGLKVKKYCSRSCELRSYRERKHESAAVPAGVQVIDLDNLLLSPAVYRSWSSIATREAERLRAMGVDRASIPDERARALPDGSLTIFVRLPDGSEVSMRVPPEHWALAGGPRA